MSVKKPTLAIPEEVVKFPEVLTSPYGSISVRVDNLTPFAIAALTSYDWNQIGIGHDQAARECWHMAEAMVRNKP